MSFAEDYSRQSKMLSAISLLPKSDQILINLLFVDEYSPAQVAGKYHLDEDKLKRHMMKIIYSLRTDQGVFEPIKSWEVKLGRVKMSPEEIKLANELREAGVPMTRIAKRLHRSISTITNLFTPKTSTLNTSNVETKLRAASRGE
jgi:hypothetical protein